MSGAGDGSGGSGGGAGGKTALIVGAGSGISAAVARALAADGYRIALAARGIDDLDEIARETGAVTIACDAGDPGSVARLFEAVDAQLGRLDVAVYNASYRARGAIAELDPAEVMTAITVSAYGGFLVGQQAARRMLAQGLSGRTAAGQGGSSDGSGGGSGSGSGTIVFTGASASVKGYAQSAPFAMGKFALRGLAQSMARELHPKGVHVAHVVIDGGVRNAARGRVEGTGETTDSLLDPAAIADSYLALVRQPRSAWSWEIELRPWVERF